MYDLSTEKQSQLLTFLQKEYNLPPLTYALMVLFKENSLEQFPQWVSKHSPKYVFHINYHNCCNFR